MHGANWQAVYDKYRPLVPFVGASRRPRLPDRDGRRRALGRPLVYLEPGRSSRYRSGVRSACWAPTMRSRTDAIASSTIYTGENWNPELQAPLSAPGVQVAEGDYLLEVNGPRAGPANQHL